MDGILIVNKEKGYTSRDVVNVVEKTLNTPKIGHTGTLDPIATGVLVLCVGKATRLVDILTCESKEYIAEVTLGLETDTLDITGNISKEMPVKINKEEIINTLNSFVGTYLQEVPNYSAIKVNGERLYKYARKGEKIELPKREVKIYSLELVSDIKYENNKTIFKIKTKVSKGTYIRSLIRDIALKLNTVGVMSELTRIKQGKFDIKDSYTLNDIKNGNYKIKSMEEVLNDIYTVKVDKYLDKKISNGVQIPNIYHQDEILFKNDDGIIALYKNDDGTLKMDKYLK